MESAETIAARAARLQEGLERAFGVRAKSLDTALRRTGRRLPRRLRAEARRVVDAQKFGGQPKLMRQVDAAALDRAEGRVLDYLGGIDRADRRKGRLLALAGVLAFNLLFVVTAFIVWMWWTGRV
ncbi:hypothetical protein [uncultured Tateyamaria sp.]|uniref:hypothetical protein n=1 Tax=Tateyamaria sp. 1078 TaxID=3417464 RepID=UPI002616AB3C|nr:hypothetical protein [uncultured Tateyamaria sp.]